MYKKRKPLTEEQITYIQENYQTMSVPNIALGLKITEYKVAQAMRKLNLIAKIKKKKLEIDWNDGIWTDQIHQDLYPSINQ